MKKPIVLVYDRLRKVVSKMHETTILAVCAMFSVVLGIMSLVVTVLVAYINSKK